MKLKKFIASVVATSLVGTTFAMTSISITASADTIGHAWIMMQDGNPSNGTGVANWNMNDAAGYVDITGNGNYTLSLDVPEGCGAEQIDFLGISSDINIYQQDATETPIYDEMTFDITSIIIDGVQISYNGPSAGANGTNDDGSTYRLSIYDEWSDRNVQDIDNKVACATNITINFTVNGIKEAQTPNDDNNTEQTEAPTETEAPDNTTEANKETTKTNDQTTTANDQTTKSDVTTTNSSNKSDSSSNDNKDADVTVVAGNPGQGETGDVGIASVVLLFALAGTSAIITRKSK